MDEKIRRSERFGQFVDQLAAVIGHADRHQPLSHYCTGLLVPGRRKSVEPMAARICPSRVSAEHQSLLHFVGQSPWSDEAVLRVTRQYALPVMERHGPVEALIVDDTSIPKKGKHSVGVANQYCGVLGKNHNCQVAVSVSVANQSASLPVAHRLYLPKSWASDSERRRKTKVPDDVGFATKWQIALSLIDDLLRDEEAKVPRECVLADAGYGDCLEFREGLTQRGLTYVVGVSKTTTVWPPGTGPLPAPPYSGRGRPPTRPRRNKEQQPTNALDLARSLPEQAWQTVAWRGGSDGDKSGRFAALRVRPAHVKRERKGALPEQWLLVEWPQGDDEPAKYWLSTQPADIALDDLVRKAKLRWQIERDYQELKQEVGFGHYEGRGWRGFHHHLTLCIAAYAFVLAERARLSPPDPRRAPPVEVPPLPRGFRPRGSPAAGRTSPADVDPDDDSVAGT